MKARLPGRLLTTGVAILLLGTVADAQTSRQEAVADSLATVLEELAWSPKGDVPAFETDTAPGSWVPDAWRLDAGATPSVRWLRVGAEESFWRLRALQRYASGEKRAAWHAVVTVKPGDASAGNLSVQTASGLLVGAAGRAGPPSASRSLAAGGEGWRTYAGRPERRSFAGMAGTLCAGGWELLLAGGERDRSGKRGGGGPIRIVALTGRRGPLSATTTAVRDEGGSGWSVGAAGRGEVARFRAELAGWSPLDASPLRLAWVFTAAARGAALDVEGQLAARDPGYVPLSGASPQALPSDGDHGWAVRAQWRGDRIRCQAMAGASQALRRVGDFPATASVRRLELTLLGGEPRHVNWRGRLASKVETVRGWSERLPWLPPAEISSRRESRLSARLSGHAGPLALRVAAGAAGLSRRLADGTTTAGWRTLVSLRADGRLGSGLEFRLNQVWAWGTAVDLVSVEVPVAGFARPRHWGRRDRERSLGLCWRGPTWRISAAVAVWEVAGTGLAHEVLVGLQGSVR